MANIVYGVSGEGSGHSSRAREMVRHLQAQGHTVKVASYGRGYRNLAGDFDTLELTGLSIISRDNKVSKLRTVLSNLANVPEGYEAVRLAKRVLFKDFKPDCVLTDFEPISAYLANHYKIPLVSLDNQHRMRYMDYPCPKRYRKDALLTETIIRAMVPKPCVSLIITFYYGPLRNERSFLFPPILRREVLAAQPSVGEHILVYVTAGYESLLDCLREFSDQRFLVYGYDRTDTDGPLQFRSFSAEGFLQDLAASKAVVATAGFTLISEALYLGKPYLAFPMRGQFEQILNGVMLEELGYGKALHKVERDAVQAFLDNGAELQARLQNYPQTDNRAITAKLDALLADGGAMLEDFHRRRQQ